MKKVTSFKVLIKKTGKYQHNHIEEGWHTLPRLAEALPDEQAWAYRFGHLINHKFVEQNECCGAYDSDSGCCPFNE